MFLSCNRNQEPSAINNLDFSADSGVIESTLNNISYSVPSPHQISLLVKEDCPYFDERLFAKPLNVELLLTSEKQALALGALGADLGYLGLYDQKEIALKYLESLRFLIKETKLGPEDQTSIFERIESSLGNSDSMLIIISELYLKGNEYLKNGDRPYLSSLVIAGGWIESFYLLNHLYEISKNSNLFGIILQQQFVIDNLIQLLQPYYKKSTEYTDLIDNLVAIAYEYDTIDILYKNSPPENQDKKNVTIIKCTFTPVLTGSHLDKIFELSKSLRENLLY